MKAVRLHQYGKPENLIYEDVPTPQPKASEVLVKVIAAGVSFLDCQLRSGQYVNTYPTLLPTVLGREFSGTVVEIGKNVEGFKRGDTVFGLLDIEHQGSYAEFIAVDESRLATAPKGLDPFVASIIPFAGETGTKLVTEGLAPLENQTILVTGATCPIGQFALAAALSTGAKVVAGVRPQSKTHALNLFPNVQIIDLENKAELDELGPIDGIADTIGSQATRPLLDRLKPEGTIATVARLPKSPRMTVSSFEEKPDIPTLLKAAQAVIFGQVKLSVEFQLALPFASVAHELIETKKARGPVVLVPNPQAQSILGKGAKDFR